MFIHCIRLLKHLSNTANWFQSSHLLMVVGTHLHELNSFIGRFNGEVTTVSLERLTNNLLI